MFNLLVFKTSLLNSALSQGLVADLADSNRLAGRLTMFNVRLALLSFCMLACTP